MLLKLKDITVYYGSARAVSDVNIEITEGSVVSIIGANGSGKSTIMKAISGLLKISSGEIWFQNKRVDKLAAHHIVDRGIVQVPEGRCLFPYMTVLNNIKLGAFLRKDKKTIAQDLAKILDDFPLFADRRNQLAGTMSGGEQQILAIARALMANPKLLLLDEPSIGLSPLMVEEIITIIKRIHQSGISVLLVEQNAGLVTQVTDDGYVIEVGKVVLSGSIKELMDNEMVQRVFLGM